MTFPTFVLGQRGCKKRSPRCRWNYQTGGLKYKSQVSLENSCQSISIKFYTCFPISCIFRSHNWRQCSPSPPSIFFRPFCKDERIKLYRPFAALWKFSAYAL